MLRGDLDAKRDFVLAAAAVLDGINAPPFSLDPHSNKKLAKI